MRDLRFTILSIALVWIYSTFHLKSFFLSTFGMMQVLMVFPFTLFIYKELYQISMFSMLQLLVIFILLGIAADNFFIFNDAWTQALAYPTLKSDSEKRLAYTYRRAARAIIVTSSTTAIAFLSTCFSPIMPIASFGVWASTCVIVNFFMTITLFPAFLSIHEKYVKYQCCTQHQLYKYICCCVCKNKLKKEEGSDTEQAKELRVVKDGGEQSEGLSVPGHVEGERTEGVLEPIQDEGPQVPGDPELSLVQYEGENTKRKIAANLDNDNQSPCANGVQSPTNHNQITDIPYPNNSKKGSSQYVPETKDYGVIEKFFDNQWNKLIRKGSLPLLAVFTIWICVNIYLTTTIKKMGSPTQWFGDDHPLIIAEHLIQDEFTTGQHDFNIEVSFVWGIQGLDEEGTDFWDPYDNGDVIWDANFNLVTNSEAKQLKFIEICEELRADDMVFKSVDGLTCFIDDFKNWVLTQTNGTFPVPANQFIAQLLTFTVESEVGQKLRKEMYIGFIENDLKMIIIKAITTGALALPPSYTEPIMKKWDETVDNWNSESLEGMNKMFQNSPGFAWMETWNEFVRSAVQGMLIAISFAFFVLLISTLNIIITVYATLSVAGIIICVLGVMRMNDWEFGIIESVSCVILIGFSVDYVVHLAANYCEAPFYDRHKRIQESLKQIGISILGGAITTLLAGLALFFCSVSFFKQFAILITSSIMYSLAFSLIFFTSLCHLLGPQGTFGNLKPIIMRVKDKCSPKKKICIEEGKENE